VFLVHFYTKFLVCRPTCVDKRKG